MPYTLREAAEAVGMGKPAILKAIQKGTISATKNEHGQWLIEPAELHRVYPPKPGTSSDPVPDETEETLGNGNGNRWIHRELDLLREERERERSLLQSQIEDLRRDRDDLKGERDKLLRVIEEQATSVKMLTHQPEPVPPVSTPLVPEPAGQGRLARAWSILRGRT